MVDTQRLKESCDLRNLVEHDLGPASRRGGRAHLWKCPFHQERKGYSLAVWANGYRCFGACNTSGDALDWLMNYRRLSFTEAVSVLGNPSAITASTEPHRFTSSCEPPEWEWQQAAEQVVNMAEEVLWSERGEPALNYLIARGLNTATIQSARLGYVPGDFREWRKLEDLDVPCGITIPWFAADALWAVKVRRAAGTPKYQQITGGNANGLYGADELPKHHTALFCEGEFDKLLVAQEAGDLITAVTLGSATTNLNLRWYAELTHCHTLFVAYDEDAAGTTGNKRLLALSSRFRQLSIPSGKDISEFYLDGGDVYSWIEEAIAKMKAERNHE